MDKNVVVYQSWVWFLVIKKLIVNMVKWYLGRLTYMILLTLLPLLMLLIWQLMVMGLSLLLLTIPQLSSKLNWSWHFIKSFYSRNDHPPTTDPDTKCDGDTTGSRQMQTKLILHEPFLSDHPIGSYQVIIFSLELVYGFLYCSKWTRKTKPNCIIIRWKCYKWVTM